jgi:RNA polymerase sigma-B factor
VGSTSSTLQKPLLGTIARLHCGLDEGVAKRRENLIASHIPMASRIARSFAGRGEELDDLTQVAMLELVKAASKFDPARGVAFAQYASPCIAGGVKRHFRDNGWSLHVTRRMQELHLQTSKATPALTQLLGRHPTISDLAAHLKLSEMDARDGVQGGLAYRTTSLSTPAGDSEDTELGQLLGAVDKRLESVPDRHLLGAHVAMLTSREQHILRLRFSGGLSQSEIGKKLGISQMQVSRLLARSIDQLRVAMCPDEVARPANSLTAAPFSGAAGLG